MSFRVKKKYGSESIASRFMAAVDDHLLVEILIRLPRLGPAITVCKRWHSLIISDHTFLLHTLHHHRRRQNCDPDPSYTPPCSLLLGNRPTDPCLQILSRKSTILDAAMSRQSPQRTLFGFVSDLKSEDIRASFNDSLLLHVDGEYRIYKPVTREQLVIPNPPPADDWGIKLMLVGSEEPDGIFRFRIVKFRFSEPLSVTVFSSETGRWNECFLKFYPLSEGYQMVAAGGAIHWQKDYSENGHSGIYVYNPFCEANDPSSVRMVKLPSGARTTAIYNISTRLGAVRGKFRLSQMFDKKLRIWELKNDVWKLVHEVWLKMEIKGVPLRMEMKGEILKMEIQKRIEKRMRGESMGVVAFHPEDGDVIFVSCGFAIYECRLKHGDGGDAEGEAQRFRKVGEVADHDPRRIEVLHIFLRVFPLVHPWY